MSLAGNLCRRSALCARLAAACGRTLLPAASVSHQAALSPHATTSATASASAPFAGRMVTRWFCTDAVKKLDPKMKEAIDKMIEKDNVVLFMKGNPEQPMCGFSRAVVLVLQMHAVPFASYDVLDNQELREAIKVYSDWPTIPQLYVNKEFVGGCDIVVQMHQQGQITDMFDSAGIKSKHSEKL